MTTPFPFVAAAVLTAAQMNAITTLVTSTKTASHTLTIADVSTRVIMNSSSATTITVNTSIFGASDVVEILNIGSGVCTVTAGTCTVGTSGSLALAQNAGGTLTFISAGVSVFRANGVAASASGLIFISSTSFTTATSVSLPTNSFSATYENYLISINVTAAVSAATMTARLRTSGTDNTAGSYQNQQQTISNAAAVTFLASSNQTSFAFATVSAGSSTNALIEVRAPNLAQHTNLYNRIGFLLAGVSTNTTHGGAMFEASTVFDSFTFISSVASNITGNIKVYGYANS